MNIFEYLGLPTNHRADNKVVQLVKNFAEVNPKVEEGLLHKKVSFPMFVQEKKDGVFCIVLVKERGKEVKLFNRTGKAMTNCTGLSGYYKKSLLEEGVYLGELCSMIDCSLEELSGSVNPNRVNALNLYQETIAQHLTVHMFDLLRIEEFILGLSDRKYLSRYNTLRAHADGISGVINNYRVSTAQELYSYADSHISRGDEGVVAKQDVGYLCGAKDWHQMKIVRGMHVDLECIGWEEGTGKYTGLVSNLLFRYAKGKTVKAMLGKGWTHSMAEQMYQDTQLTQRLNSPIGKIYHVYGLQPSSKNGVIRLPKVGELRHDKAVPDY